MSGLLHRLASRAMGSAHPLQSSAHLPYTAHPLPVNMAAEPDGQIAVLESAGHERDHGINSGAEQDSVSNQQQHPASHLTETHPQPSTEHKDARSSPESLVALENEDTRASPDVLVAQSSFEFSVKPERTPPPISSVKSMLRQSQASVEKMVVGVPSVSAEGVEIDVPMNTPATDPIAKEKQHPTLPDDESLSPLLPLKNSMRSPALNAVPQRGEPGTSIWQGSVEDPTEVHVSIGRIEVTAVHEAPQ
ncbi:MAG: hypothetical protein Q9M23_03335, partial [Mariprofundaceae bacterium]|nr:hypothetical protein [Mariprofundaceae bacterium]